MLLELVTKEMPFKGLNLGATVMTVATGKRPTLPDGVSTALRSLLNMAWHQDRDKRPSFAEVRETLATFTPRDLMVAEE